MCFFRDEKQQCIQIVQAHDDQTVILQTSDESFHDANEATSCKLDLIKLCPRLGTPPPRAKIITSQADQTSPAAKRVTQGKVMFDEMLSTVQEPSVIEKWAPFRGPLQPCTGALFKREPLAVERWASYQNNQHDELSPMVPRSAPYDHPMQPPFKPLTALFSPVQEPHSEENQWPYRNQTSIKMISITRWVQWYQNQPHMTALYRPRPSPLWPHSKSPYSLLWPCSKEITSLYSMTTYTKVFSSTSREKCSLWDLLSTADSPTNSTANNMFRVYIYWKIQKQ